MRHTFIRTGHLIQGIILVPNKTSMPITEFRCLFYLRFHCNSLIKRMIIWTYITSSEYKMYVVYYYDSHDKIAILAKRYSLPK